MGQIWQDDKFQHLKKPRESKAFIESCVTEDALMQTRFKIIMELTFDGTGSVSHICL